MKQLRYKFYIFFSLLIIAAPSALKAQTANFLDIKNYTAYYAWGKRYPMDVIILRRFENAGETYYLSVNPQTLQTRIDQTSFYQVQPTSLDEVRTTFKKTPYEKAISSAEKQSIMIQDAGIERGMPKETGISLTADLCPSHRPLDKIIFQDIIKEFQRVERPVPVALSITGIWMKQHPQDLEWLKQLMATREINITWINHSYNHRVSKSLPIKENFLLEAGTDITFEVLETEKAMLRNGLLPSVFFRFPGLVSDQQLVYQITAFGLIPIGTDAWLAKGQKPQAGSIVLIHGNGNEPVGVKDFIQLLKSEAGQITKKQWLLYDLRESVDEEFETQQ
jgi:hypothetical protein